MTYLIDYSYGELTHKRIRVKNCDNEFVAKSKLHNYLTNKYGERELIITKCVLDMPDIFNDIFNNFNCNGF